MLVLGFVCPAYSAEVVDKKEEGAKATPVSEESVWTDDYDSALKKARAEKKNLLLLFTGSTWCPPCKMLEREVFSTAEFKKFAKENMVCVLMDYDRQNGWSSKKFAQKHEELSNTYNLRGFPTVVLISYSNLKKVDVSIGLEYKTPEAFIQWVSAFNKSAIK